MKNIKTFGGRLFALLFICVLSLSFLTFHVTAASNVWGEWQSATIEDETENKNLIISLQNSFAVELWHYSGGFWGNNFVKIYDSQVFDDPNELAKKVNAQMSFEMSLPQEVITEINNGYNVEIVLGTYGIPLNEIFDLDKDITFKYEDNKLIFNAYPKLNFYKENNMTYQKFIKGLNKAIPFVVAPYGYNRYAMWTKNGKPVGAADGYFNPNDPYELGVSGTIHPSQIVNNKGHLQDGLDIYVDRENGTNEWIRSNDIAIGYGTFANAGAVAIHFDYPVTISFYRGAKMADGPDVAVANIEKTSYPANQGVIATVTVQNLGKDPQETSLDFSIPNITNVSELVYLEAGETKTVDFYFQTPGNGPISMTANANKNKDFVERDYSNNIKTVEADIVAPPDITNPFCSETITWTETDYHTVSRPCPNHGSHSYKCYHTYTYQATLSATDTISPNVLKSGYGFEVGVNTVVSTKLMSESGCDNYRNPNRKPTKEPKVPTNAEVRLNYMVTNSLGTQPYTVTLERNSSTTTTTSFITAQNPISVKKSRNIFTDVALKGTAEAPFTHSFDIYISGGGVNGVEFCKKITETFTINGSMYDDDGTTS